MTTQTTNNIATIVAIKDTRLPYHPALAELGCDKATWRFLVESLYPNAKSIEGVAMAIRYCKARNLDILKKPVHVVPVYSSLLKKSVEMVWPGIGDYRVTAARTGEYAGCDETECGDTITETFSGIVDEWENGSKTGTRQAEVSLQFCEWMRVTVYRIIKGQKHKFVGPKVYFKEIYSRLKHDCPIPNDRWQRAPNGQLEKCAEASALRKAFPEEIGTDPTAEEMEGKVVDMEPVPLRQATQEEINKAVTEKMPPPETTKEGEIPPDTDWQLLLDELIPGLNKCASKQELDEFLEENWPHVDDLSRSPRKIQEQWSKLFTTKQKTLDGQNGH